ncbi:MAG TPA: Fe-S-containing protein [Candidatus Binataceae bacterium]|nr:Fe-S-containing protein [Candidatus Binataceae bacterium]
MKVRLRTVIATTAVAAVAFAMTISIAQPGCTSVAGKDELVISGRLIDKGSAHFFCYRDDAGKQLRFVLARGSDGTMHSVMDACSQCYANHKGFECSGGYLICRQCGNRYPIDHMMNGKASCVPIALPEREAGGKVTIRTADLKKMEWLF